MTGAEWVRLQFHKMRFDSNEQILFLAIVLSFKLSLKQKRDTQEMAQQIVNIFMLLSFKGCVELTVARSERVWVIL